MTTTKYPDIRVENHGSLFLFHPLTAIGRLWIKHNVNSDNWWAGALVVEHRFARDLAHGMQSDGLEVI